MLLRLWEHLDTAISRSLHMGHVPNGTLFPACTTSYFILWALVKSSALYREQDAICDTNMFIHPSPVKCAGSVFNTVNQDKYNPISLLLPYIEQQSDGCRHSLTTSLSLTQSWFLANSSAKKTEMQHKLMTPGVCVCVYQQLAYSSDKMFQNLQL